jgi:hypothetical protein
MAAGRGAGKFWSMATTTHQTRGQIVAALPVALRASAEALFRSFSIAPSGKSAAGEPLFSPSLVRTAIDTTDAETRAAKNGLHRVNARAPGVTRSASGEADGRSGIQFARQ